MLRLLHTADWQIGRQFATLSPENAPLLAEARLGAVERLAALATRERVDAVLVAGDVFDAQTVGERTVRRLFNALAGFSGPWLLLPGNHDAALADSVWTRARQWGAVPAQAHLVLTPELRLFEVQGFALLPAPLTQRHTHHDLTAWFDAIDTPAGMYRIGLAHGSVQGVLAEDIADTNPIAPDRAVRARLDYLALGDWHGMKRIDARTWYSGTPEPDRFRDNAAGHALLVEIAAPGAEPQVTPVPIAQHRWQQWDSALQVPSDLDALLTQLAALGPADVLDLRASGTLDLAARQRLDSALAQAEARTRHLQADLSALRLAPTADDIAALHADGYLGEVIGELQAEGAADGPAAATARDALALLTQVLAGRSAAPAVGPEGAP